MGREFHIDGDFDGNGQGGEPERSESALFNTQEAEIAGVLVRQLGCEAHEVTRDATLESLGADSLDGVELVMELEEHFEIEISDDEAESIETVADIFKIVKEAREHEEDAR